MMTHTTLQALGQTRIAELHDQARRDALVRAARRARHARETRAPGLLAGLTRRARPQGPRRGAHPASGVPARLGPDLPCTDDPELFFAESPGDAETAKALCRECPARAGCLAGALERREPWGVWGGDLFLRGVTC